MASGNVQYLISLVFNAGDGERSKCDDDDDDDDDEEDSMSESFEKRSDTR